MCWLPVGLVLVAAAVGGLAARWAMRSGLGPWGVALWGLGCAAAVLGAGIVVLLRAAREAYRETRQNERDGTPPPA